MMSRKPEGERPLPKKAPKKPDGTLDRDAMLTFVFAHCDDDNDGNQQIQQDITALWMWNFQEMTEILTKRMQPIKNQNAWNRR